MDGLDASIRSVLEAANIDEESLATINHDDLRDLFPGAENFFQRKKLWDCISQMQRPVEQIANTAGSPNTTSGEVLPSTSPVPPCQLKSSSPMPENDKTIKLPDPPEYVLYTDSELEMVRSQYFSLLRNGNVKDFKMSKELCCRLVRNTVTSMVAILRASPMGKEVKYPSKLEIRTMAQKIVDYYPMLRDADQHMPHLTIYTKLFKRLQNMRSPKKMQGSMPQRGKAKKTLFRSNYTEDGAESDISGETISDVSGDTAGFSDSTIPLESHDDLSEDSQIPEKGFSPKTSRSATSSSSSASGPSNRPSSSSPPGSSNRPSSSSPPGSSNRPSSSSPPGSSKRVDTTLQVSPDNATANQDSLKIQARHYKTLSNMYKKPNAKPNPTDVVQVLNLEFKARRAFIDADITREEERPAKFFAAYPCFKEIRHAMDELSQNCWWHQP